MGKGWIPAHTLHLVSEEEARQTFTRLLGTGGAWNSPLMQYRTTSKWQTDWVVEGGNWLVRADQLGFQDVLLRNFRGRRNAVGVRDAHDPVHRGVAQWLFHAMAAHYFVGTGWTFIASEPKFTYLLRGDGTIADIDLQLATREGQVVDIQLKAPGTLGLHDNTVDPHILEAVRGAARQLPDPAVGPSFIVIGAQRGWPLSTDTYVLEELLGSTSCYQDGRLLLHEESIGELAQWPHVSGIVMLDYVRSSPFSYGCSVLLNPWAYYPSKPRWFPHARVLSCDGQSFKWHRGAPPASTFGSRRNVARLAGPRR